MRVIEAQNLKPGHVLVYAGTRSKDRIDDVRYGALAGFGTLEVKVYCNDYTTTMWFDAADKVWIE